MGARSYVPTIRLRPTGAASKSQNDNQNNNDNNHLVFVGELIEIKHAVKPNPTRFEA